MPVSDFDLTIREVLLVHRNSWVPHFAWTHYKSGRQMDGLVCVQGGSAQYDFGTDRLTAGAGAVFFLPATAAYTVRCTSEEPFVHYTANFRLTDLHADDSTLDILLGKRRFVTAAAPRYSGLFERLLSVWQGKSPGYRMIAKAHLYELLELYLTEAAHQHHPREGEERLRPAVSRLDHAFAEEDSVGELAALCSLSETHFRRLFRVLYGLSPVEYRREKRIAHAKDLLTLGQYTTAEIARECGFSDPSYFSRVFREITGLSPGEFRTEE